MAIALVQSKTSEDVDDSIATTFDSTPTDGNLLISFVYGNAASAGISITGWTSAGSTTGFGASSAHDVHCLYKVASGDAALVTATGTGNTVIEQHIYEYSGLATSSVLDQFASNQATSNVTTLTAGPVTTTVADELLIAVMGTNGTTTAEACTGFTVRNTTARTVTADQIVSATSGYSAVWSWSTGRNAGVLLATFKIAGAATGQPFALRTRLTPHVRIGRGGPVRLGG